MLMKCRTKLKGKAGCETVPVLICGYGGFYRSKLVFFAGAGVSFKRMYTGRVLLTHDFLILLCLDSITGRFLYNLVPTAVSFLPDPIVVAKCQTLGDIC
jgi:hypothetical protein